MTSPKSTLHDIPGGEALIGWFGCVPRFHDAELLEITFSGKGAGLLRIQAWNVTDEVDAKGYLVPDKHATATLTLDGVTAIHCIDFDMMPAIIFDLEITQVEENYRIQWSASYGVAGFIIAKHVRINLAPGKPD
ncbi:hypothetical protein [Mesorhizobium amorphae]|uniref:hypothetical protein n=1 Tax=Mesorhizobium amorphae TaxID=71433 RepID=UPI0011837392|nr:hypothetical protein [Mesorhizobium amorphae]